MTDNNDPATNPRHPFLAATLCVLILGWLGAAQPAGATDADPATAALDLTTNDPTSGWVNDAFFSQGVAHPAGSGYGALDTFLKINTTNPVEQGYNTDFRYPDGVDPNGHPYMEFDQITDHHTRSMQLSEVPIFQLNGSWYLEFLLDINELESGVKEFLSLDQLRLYLSDDGLLHDYAGDWDGDGTAGWDTLADKFWDMNPNTGDDNWVAMNYDIIGGGSGFADIFVYVPIALDVYQAKQESYLYLYSMFGVHIANDNKLEEWGVAAPVPEPATMLLFGSGLAGLGALLRRRQEEVN